MAGGGEELGAVASQSAARARPGPRRDSDPPRSFGALVAPLVFLVLVVGLVSLVSASGVLPVGPREPAPPAPARTLTTVLILSPAGPVDQAAGTAPADSAVTPSQESSSTADTEASAPSGEAAVSGSETQDTLGSEQRYVVGAGDTPVSIAERFGVSVESLMELNDIVDPTNVLVGTELKIPAK